MTIFGIEHAGLFVAIYLVGTYVSTMVYMMIFAEDRNVGSAGLILFAILWPVFVLRGFIRTLVKGWRELNPRPEIQVSKNKHVRRGSGSFL
jgi:hypothetical protein